MSDPDPLAILAELGVTGMVAVEPLTGGVDTTVWRVDTGTALSVLRVLREHQVSRARREVMAMRAAGDAGIPVPRVLGEMVWRNRPALLLSWCGGRPMLRDVQTRPWRVWSLGTAMGRWQARLHAVTAPHELHEGVPSWLTRVEERSPALVHRLRSAVSPGQALLHFDFHPLNLIADDAGITGIIDWANTCSGDPRADVARTYAMLRLGPVPPGISSFAPTALRALLTRAWWNGYCDQAGPPHDMAPFFAAAGVFMLHDLRGRLDEVRERRIRLWTDRWMRRALVGS